MKQDTTLNIIIERIEASKLTAEYPEVIEYATYLSHFLQSFLILERQQIQKAFEDGVGEGLTDPERPLTGKEYFELRYGINTEKK